MLKMASLIVTLTLVILSAPLSVDAQQAGKVRRIGYLTVPTRESAEFGVKAFQQGLRDLGWVEGQNLAIEYRFADGKLDRLPDLAAELVRLKVDIIVVGATPAALAAKNATTTIPIVMVLAVDPVGMGLVASLARPGGNITGLTTTAGGLEIIGKQLELLKAVVPKVSRVAFLSDPTDPLHAMRLREIEVAGRALGVKLQLLEARGPGEFDSAFAAMTRERAGALLVAGTFFTHQTRIIDLAVKGRLPSMFTQREAVEAGGLMAYATNLADLFRRAATYVDKILKGAKPADLPVEQPTKFELIINLKTAKVLGLTIPKSVLIRADKLIE